MRTPVVLAATAAGVILTGTSATADTPPSPSGWTVTDHRTTTLAPTAAAAPWTVTAPTPDDAAPSTRVPDPAPAGRQHRTTSRTGPRPTPRTGSRAATGCQETPGGVWRVRPGDTLWRISICTGRDLAELIAVNGLADGGRLIFPGDPITITRAPAATGGAPSGDRQ